MEMRNLLKLTIWQLRILPNADIRTMMEKMQYLCGGQCGKIWRPSGTDSLQPHKKMLKVTFLTV